MVSIFKKNELSTLLLLLPYTILLRLYSLLHPEGYEIAETDTVISTGLFTAVSSPMVQSIIAIILVFIQAVIINLLVNNHRLFGIPSGLAGMFYVLLACCIPAFQLLTPPLIANTFIILAIYFAFNTYKTSTAASDIFNSALAASLAALIYPPYAAIIVALFFGFTILRNFNMTERLQFFLGYLALLWIFGSVAYYFDMLTFDWWREMKLAGAFREISWSDRSVLFYLGGALLLILVGLLNYYNFMKKKGISIRKKIDVFYWLLLSGFLSLLIFSGLGYDHFHILTIPLAMFLAMYNHSIKNVAVTEIMHFVLLAGVFYLLFRSYIDPAALNSF